MINFVSLQPNAETEDGITPLLSAVAAGSLTCLLLLIEVRVLVQYCKFHQRMEDGCNLFPTYSIYALALVAQLVIS